MNDTGGGAYIEGEIHTNGGDFIGRDKITTGNVSGSIAAIGAGAQVIYTNIERRLTEVEIAEQAEAREKELLAESVTAYVKRLARKAETAEQVSSLSTPYKALLEYDIQDAALFYGRSDEIEKILRQLERNKLTVLHAESGAGKTSLLKAGIIPRILAQGHLPVYLRPYNMQVQTALKRSLLLQSDDTLALGKATLYDFLRKSTDLLAGQRMVVIVDQFEELFTVQSEDDRAEFIDQLAPCLEDDLLPVHWIFAVRGEWLSQLSTFRPRIRNPFANEFLLQALSREQAREVIFEPARRQGVDYAPALVDHILDDLGGNTIDPPQLQLVCSILFEALDDGKQITRELYEQVGRASGILRGHMDRVLSRDIPREQRQVARQLLEALVTSEKLRALRQRDDLIHELKDRGIGEDVLTNVLDQLVNSRLLRVEQSGGDRDVLAYELAHDYLLEEIELDPTVQARKAAQELLAQKLPYYSRDKLLLSADEMGIISPHRQWLSVSTEAENLLRESQNAITRRRRITISAAAGAIILILGAIFAAVLIRTNAVQEQANIQGTAAAEQAKIASTALAAQMIAESEAAKALSRQLASQSLQNLETRNGLALLLALESMKTAPTVEGRSSLLTALLQNPRLITRLRGSKSSVTTVEFSPDGRILAAANEDGDIIVWDMEGGDPQGRVFRSGLAGVNDMAFSPGNHMLALVGNRGEFASINVIVWDLGKETSIEIESDHHDGYNRTVVAYSPDGKLLACGGLDILIWDIQNQRWIGEPLEGHEYLIQDLAFTQDNQALISAGIDGVVYLWDLRNGKSRLISLDEPTNAYSLDISPDGSTLAIGQGVSGRVDLINLANLENIHTLGGHSDAVKSVAFNPHNTILATGSEDGTIILWKESNLDEVGEQLTGQSGPVESLSFSPDGRILASGGGKEVILWDIAGIDPFGVELDNFISTPYSLAFSPDGRSLAVGGYGDVEIWDSDNNLVKTLDPGYSNDVEGLIYRPDGQMLITLSETRITFLDLGNGSLLNEQIYPAHGMALSHDGRTLFSAWNREIQIWDLDDFTVTARLSLEDARSPIDDLDISPDDRLLAVANFNKVYLYDLDTMQLLGEPLTAQGEGTLHAVSFSPDGQILAGAGGLLRDAAVRGEITLWNVITQKPIGSVFTGHTESIHSLAFSPDGQILVSTSSEETILWDVAAGQTIGEPIPGRTYGNYGNDFSPDGKLLAVTGYYPIFYDMNSEAWEQRACRKVNRNLSRSEWDRFIGSAMPYHLTCPQLSPGEGVDALDSLSVDASPPWSLPTLMPVETQVFDNGREIPDALSADSVAWENLSKGWYLMLYDHSSDVFSSVNLYLINPNDDVYLMARWLPGGPQPTRILGWSDDGKRVLLEFSRSWAEYDTDIWQIDLTSGSLEFIAGTDSRLLYRASYINSNPREIILQQSQNGNDQIIKIDPSNPTSSGRTVLASAQATNALPFPYENDLAWIVSPDGNTLVLRIEDRLHLAQLDGAIIQDLDSPGYGCLPLKWWTEQSILGACRMTALDDFKTYFQLWLIPIDGNPASALTNNDQEQVSHYGYFEALRGQDGRTVVQWLKGCDVASGVGLVQEDGFVQEINIHHEFRNQILLAIRDEDIAVLSTPYCRRGGILMLVDTLGNIDRVLVPQIEGQEGVIDALFFAR